MINPLKKYLLYFPLLMKTYAMRPHFDCAFESLLEAVTHKSGDSVNAALVRNLRPSSLRNGGHNEWKLDPVIVRIQTEATEMKNHLLSEIL